MLPWYLIFKKLHFVWIIASNNWAHPLAWLPKESGNKQKNLLQIQISNPTPYFILTIDSAIWYKCLYFASCTFITLFFINLWRKNKLNVKYRLKYWTLCLWLYKNRHLAQTVLPLAAKPKWQYIAETDAPVRFAPNKLTCELWSPSLHTDVTLILIHKSLRIWLIN